MAPAARERCSPSRARTIVENERVRVYSVPDDDGSCVLGGVYACYRSTGHERSLDGPPESFAFRGPAIALNRTVVGYAIEDCVEECFALASAVDATARSGGRRPARIGRPGRVKVGSPRVKPNMALAWITCPGRRSDPRGDRDFPGRRLPNCVRPGSYNYVFKLDSGGRIPRNPKRLDRGHGIDPSSLRLRGSRLSWVKNGRRRYATLR